MKLIISILLLSYVSVTNAQQLICSLTEQQINNNVFICLKEDSKKNIFQNDIIEYISSEIGITPNFIFKYCPNIHNAGAIINPYKNNSRYILYDSDFFEKLYKSDKYYALFIIAHEIGHHLNGDVIPKNETLQQAQQKELNADYFAGFIMFKLGASENDIINTINKFPDPGNDYSTHPRNTIRINYALKGFMNEANKYKEELYSIKNQLQQQIHQENQIKTINELISVLNEYTITEDDKYLDVAEYLLSKVQHNSALIVEMKAFIDYMKGRYNSSFDFYLKKYKESKKDDDLIYLLNILKHTEIKSNEITLLINNILTNSNNPKALLNIGIYYNQINDKLNGFNAFKKAYDLIKNQENSILKSDIYFAYGRSIYDQQLTKESSNFTYSKMLLEKARQIIEIYPNDNYYRKYYSSILFHLGNIQNMDQDYLGAIDTYNKLLEIEKERIDYIYKVNANLGNLYFNREDYSKSIQYFTSAINYCDDKELKNSYYFSRGRAYLMGNDIELCVEDFKKSCEMGFKMACESLEEIKRLINK